jgi:hypothetical protein
VAQVFALTALRTMSEIVLNVFLAPLAILLYGSGLLLWPIRRWLRRKQKLRGGFLAFVFVAQLVAYVVVGCIAVFVQLEHFYYWFIFLIELNVLFTIAGVIAWIRDARYERKVEVSDAV